MAPGPRQHRGARAYHAGAAAEAAVARAYIRRGYTIARQRWRGQAGEIDLIVRGARELVFVEVKQARDSADAARALRPAQIARLQAAAAEFLAGEPAGQLTPARFDVALVDGSGAITVIENALGQA